MSKALAFRIYNGAEGADSTIKMERDRLGANVSNTIIREVLSRFERFCAEESEVRRQYPWADRFVMGFPLPAWQRPAVWTLDQKRRFIQSIWAGVDIGSYMVNDLWEFVESRDAETFRQHSEILLDGQQRLSAIQDYVLDEFAIPDAAGVLRLWSDLPKIERNRFCMTHFACATIRSWDEQQLKLAYNLRAFGGTAHTEDQRA
ncbi:MULTISPECIES: DUF262 domain-containing protein [Achromobacter]|uniref:DUF262 domain-containing protein n=1 Tax=Achromobacter TaxID=222 RepID=UPI0023F90882|nr:DUF262 domain-containing protein [Achromobacter anxifer]MDF8363356.1 DUF262 domain-containing protein [Achromobacter anxifer]